MAIPFLVVQPIVENAIRHGLERKEGAGHISVSGFGEGPLCVIEIEDDGIGMHPDLAAPCWRAPARSRAASGWPTSTNGCAPSTVPSTVW